MDIEINCFLKNSLINKDFHILYYKSDKVYEIKYEDITGCHRNRIIT